MQGHIQGSVTQSGRQGQIAVAGYSHGLVAPFDTVSGKLTGKKTSKPFVISKDVDASTPLLYNALANNESMTEFTLNFWRPTQSGSETVYLVISLTNALIVSINASLTAPQDPTIPAVPREEIAFVYQKIEWNWVNGGILADVNW